MISEQGKLPYVEGVRVTVDKEIAHPFVPIASRLEMHGTKFRRVSFALLNNQRLGKHKMCK